MDFHVEEGNGLLVHSEKRIRKDFGTLPSVMEAPALAIQLDSYREFLTGGSIENTAQSTGLEAAFQSVFPINRLR